MKKVNETKTKLRVMSVFLDGVLGPITPMPDGVLDSRLFRQLKKPFKGTRPRQGRCWKKQKREMFLE